MINTNKSIKNGKSINSNSNKFRKTLYYLMIIMGVIFFCLISKKLLLKVLFIDLSLEPIQQFQVKQDWDYESYAIQRHPYGIPPFSREYYIVRKTTLVFSSEKYGNISQNSIISYYSNKLNNIGWERYHNSGICHLYLAEANFLESGDEGYIAFRRRSYREYPGFEEGDTVCLAVWPSTWQDEGTPATYRLVLLTVKPSLLTLVGAMLQLN